METQALSATVRLRYPDNKETNKKTQVPGTQNGENMHETNYRPTDKTSEQTKMEHMQIEIQRKPSQANASQAKPIQAKQHTGTNTRTSYVSRSEMSRATARIPQPRDKASVMWEKTVGPALYAAERTSMMKN